MRENNRRATPVTFVAVCKSKLFDWVNVSPFGFVAGKEWVGVGLVMGNYNSFSFGCVQAYKHCMIITVYGIFNIPYSAVQSFKSQVHKFYSNTN